MKKRIKKVLSKMRDLFRLLKGDKTLKYKIRFSILAIVLILGLYVSVKLISGSYARYYSKKSLVMDTSAALFILDPGEYKFDMDLEGLVPSDNDYTYMFTISNFTDNKVSQVDMEYSLKMVTTTNLPLTYRLYKNEEPTNGTSILSSQSIVQDADTAWYNVFNIATTSTFIKSTKKTDTYYLVVNFPKTYSSTIEYAGQIESAEIIVNAKQII